jgi:peptidoglycan-associated lipoprotein
MNLNKLSWFVILGLATATVGCDDPKKEPKTANDMANTATAPAPAGDSDGNSMADDKSETKTPVNIDERVTKMCKLKEPRFEFDSAALSSQARGVLDAIAKCFNDGPGKGKNLNIVGHTDERGEPQYNFGLGQKRAGSVANYLQKAGLGANRMESSSRGELDATGTDAAGWARDRRVDILLAE